MTGDPPPVQERVRFWLIPVLAVGVGAAAFAGIASERVPGPSPWPLLSLYYMFLGIDMAEPMPRWPLILGYSGAFLLWALVLVSIPPVRIGLFYLVAIGLLTCANIGWVGAFGAGDLQTLFAVLNGIMIPLVLLIIGFKLRGGQRPNSTLVHGGFLFAWIAYGAFPLLPGVFD